jgi:uncharacterized protein
MKAPDDPILRRFRAAVAEIYGDRVICVVLFGLRARGDARPDSGYDLALFLPDMPDRFVEMNRLADLSTAILDETGEFIHAMPCHADSYNERTPLMHEIARTAWIYGIFLVQKSAEKYSLVVPKENQRPIADASSPAEQCAKLTSTKPSLAGRRLLGLRSSQFQLHQKIG